MRILIVEDEHLIANSLKEGLEQEYFAVDIAYDGSDGFDLAVTEDYDLIVLDLMLPKMSGEEICQSLREKNIQAPILILTAKDQVKDRVRGLNLGADDYLVKPFSFEELLARVRAILRRPKDSLGETLSVKDLTLDSKTSQVTRGNLQLPLSIKEFSLLEYLLRNKNRTVSKDQIISHLWDYDTDVLPNTVEAHIRNLRQKIDCPFKNKEPLIETVRGFGYRISD